jgi:hypothetical protein
MVLYALRARSGERGKFFRPREDICAFIEAYVPLLRLEPCARRLLDSRRTIPCRHWDYFIPDRPPAPTWHSTVNGCVSDWRVLKSTDTWHM